MSYADITLLRTNQIAANTIDFKMNTVRLETKFSTIVRISVLQPAGSELVIHYCLKAFYYYN